MDGQPSALLELQAYDVRRKRMKPTNVSEPMAINVVAAGRHKLHLESIKCIETPERYENGFQRESTQNNELTVPWQRFV